ncbi:MAG: NUDIX domain-containing protein [Crocinitomicaceae bacterium]|nr:NUDIX domain-containing protein [Crocinitomicaceae bacterium]MCF8433161.1 NUDIX domain-containing protein [Crocinitomicaceae bacterium]
MPKFNLRIYGLLVNECRQVLVSDECRNGFSFTKFPGGGLEFGEGFKAALKREFLEELNLNVEVGELFYFNDFYQASAFNPTEQLVSFYYLVETVNWRSILTDQHVVPLTDEGEKHRWIPVSELDVDDFTFPIDKIVANRLSEAYL